MRKIELNFGEENNYFVREAFNTLRTNILFCGASIKTIVITSCYAHEGKTTVALELAKSLAQNGKQILFVDADLRMSLTAGRYTKEKGIIGLSHLLSGQNTLEECTYGTQIENMDIIFAGHYPPNPTELVGSDPFEAFLKEARERYDYVLIDAPPLGLVIDAAVMAKHCDGSVLVINKGKVRHRIVQEVLEQMNKSGCKCLGVVLNHIVRVKDESRLRSAQVKRHGMMESTRRTPAEATSAARPLPPTGARKAPPHSNTEKNK